mgnify:CR=1 FL=1
MGVPTLIQEQNSYAGLTNKILSKRAKTICTAYEGMERFFPKDKIILTGNPIRKEIAPATASQKEEAYKFFGLNPELPTVLVVGGSLGCGTLNRTMKSWIAAGNGSQFQVIWQSGKGYAAGIQSFFEGLEGSEFGENTRRWGNILNCDFISRMDLAYAAADVVISRSGASSVSELCAAHKATIFVPSPNVAEDHQTHNALALVRKDAAVLVKDIDAKDLLISTALSIINNQQQLSSLHQHILTLALPDSANLIAKEVMALAKAK